MSDNTEKPAEGPQPELMAKFDRCPVCTLRQTISTLIEVVVSYGTGPTRADVERLKSALLKIQKELDVASHLGADRYAETLAKEAKQKGHMAPDYEFYTGLFQGPVRQQTWEHKIPFGASIAGLWAGTDICLDCGTMYGVKMVKGVAVKPAIPPGQQKPQGPGGLFLGKG